MPILRMLRRVRIIVDMVGDFKSLYNLKSQSFGRERRERCEDAEFSVYTE